MYRLEGTLGAEDLENGTQRIIGLNSLRSEIAETVCFKGVVTS